MSVTQAERDIYATGSPVVPHEFLQSLFVAELIRPSRRLWISSAWISDVEVLDNSARQFSSLNPDWPAARIRLSAVLAAILERGGDIVVITNEAPHNAEFLARMAPLATRFPHTLHLLRAAALHEKGILGDHFTLNGSMNLTHGGVYVNEEYLIYRCDPAKIAERRVVLEERWGAQL